MGACRLSTSVYARKAKPDKQNSATTMNPTKYNLLGEGGSTEEEVGVVDSGELGVFGSGGVVEERGWAGGVIELEPVVWVEAEDKLG